MAAMLGKVLPSVKPNRRPVLGSSAIMVSTWLLYLTTSGSFQKLSCRGAGLGHGQEQARFHVEEAAVVPGSSRKRRNFLAASCLAGSSVSIMTALE